MRLDWMYFEGVSAPTLSLPILSYSQTERDQHLDKRMNPKCARAQTSKRSTQLASHYCVLVCLIMSLSNPIRRIFLARILLGR